MAKIKNPYSVSTAFGIPPKTLKELGVLDVTLSADTRLFVDPMLFERSKHPEFKTKAVALYREYFEKLAKLLKAAPLGNLQHAAYRASRKLLHFRELPTCLGYGASSDDGSGWGPDLANQVLTAGKEIVDMGITDPDLFICMALFEERIGPDRISDMASNVAILAIIDFNTRIIKVLGLKTKFYVIDVADGKIPAHLLPNPYLSKTPVLLMPTDVLRKLPVALDWDGVVRAAAETDALRQKVNHHIAHIWEAKTKRDRETLKSQVMSTQDAFKTLLDAIHAANREPYNSDYDSDGLIKWSPAALAAAQADPLDLKAFSNPTTIDVVQKMVRTITDQFKHLIEQRGLWRELYKDGGYDPRNESTAQRLYFAVAFAYCHANNIDISPEVDTGSGKIDFKMSVGFKARILVEIKLSTNGKVISGFTKQLETYKNAEETSKGIYVVIDVGGMGKKAKNLQQLRNEAIAAKKPVSDLIFIDGLPKKTASKQ